MARNRGSIRRYRIVTAPPASVASANASVTSAEANLDVLEGAATGGGAKVRAELDTTPGQGGTRPVSFTTIRAPFDGVIGNKAVQPGQYVQTGTRLLALVPLKQRLCRSQFQGDTDRSSKARAESHHQARRLFGPLDRGQRREHRAGFRG